MIGKQVAWWLPALCLVCLHGLPVRADESTEATAAVVLPAALVSTAAVATAPAPTTGAAPADESPIDLAILLDQHMLLVRMRVRQGDKPFIHLWQQFAESHFDAADKNHDGLLDADEFPAVKPLVAPAAANNRNMGQGNRRRGMNNPMPIVEPSDESAPVRELIPDVTRQEFVDFLRTTANGPIRTDAAFQPSAASRALFGRLDLDHDDKLSASECEHAFETLHPLDLDEADLFTRNQILTGSAGANPYFDPGQAQQRATPVRLAVKLLRFSNPSPALAWADRIRQHFGQGESKSKAVQNLRRAVMVYDEATLAAIDVDGDGTLDQAELAHLEWHPIPNLELTVDQGKEGAVVTPSPFPNRARNRMMMQQAPEGTIETTGQSLDPAFRFEPSVRSQGFNQPAKLVVGSEEVELTSSGYVAANMQGQSGQLVANLKRFDQDKNDYLEEKELRQFGNNNNFMMLDTNGDGKLYFSEIEEYVDAQAAAAAVRLVVNVVDHDHAMFESLDTDNDGRLARRELGGLVGRLAAWDRNGDGQLAFDEVPRFYTVRVGQDQPQLPINGFGFGNGNFVGGQQSRRMASQRGPAWFSQMDRNSDGDVSRREFLGSATQFRQIDADGDQLIDSEEAARAEPPVRPAAAPTPTVERAAPSSPPTEDSADDTE